MPSVIRLIYLIRRPRPQGRLTRRDIFLRDGFACQYCGKETKELTLDHVMPRHRGGGHNWENIVAACKHCNHRRPATPRKRPACTSSASHTARRTATSARSTTTSNRTTGWRKFIPGGVEAGVGFR